MSKKLLLALAALFIFSASSAHAATWKPATPEDYTSITWAKAPGIASYFKAPTGSGNLDFITRIYLPQNQIQFIASEKPPLDWGMANASFVVNMPTEFSTPSGTPTTSTESQEPVGTVTSITPTTNGPTGGINEFHNFAFPRFVSESSKTLAKGAKFIWNAPFFNITLATSDLSMAIKTTESGKTLISSGSRPPFDMAAERRMLLINNRTGKANIQAFDADIFVGNASGDVALESFAPDVGKSDGAGTARLFVGVMPSKQEIVIYCSQSATVGEASRALTAAGVPVENQLQADGGGSASCGYNLPGQYFVEPGRTLPLMMGAFTMLGRGNPTTNGLNVRGGAGTTFKIVRKLNKTDVVTILEEKGTWYRIGEDEWVSKSLIKKI